ncbi:tonB-system energizer ExbB [Phaeovibrio sulfidiphilus]|uniref:Biopolymer transport protein ExbB n=1 Tax=Phaeovibrio sulfidiphilus TaxID=1220600 RepID=A0A8J6YHU9_9PROT|nr:tonB-system energizer ExbB [Phaeovibrio sulfidiphilus]MBE1236516.1 tonB-system energizer ExbB [Phaeovibrio sulfidiphilus]
MPSPSAVPPSAPSLSAAPDLPVASDLSISAMFLGADFIVQTVIVVLVLASVATWSVWLVRSRDMRAAQARLGTVLGVLETARTLDEALRLLDRFKGPELALPGCARDERAQTAARLAHMPLCREGIKERVAARLERLEASAVHTRTTGLGFLATVGASAPFIGLFGTVWGIMNSFIGIAATRTTSLAVVAPGIAEALLATALGLVAAIPAVILYNLSTRRLSAYRKTLRDTSSAVMRLLSRDLEFETATVLRAAG